MEHLYDHPAIAGKHVVSNTRDYSSGTPRLVATCQCGWCSKVEVGDREDQDAAIDAHWQDEIAANETGRRRQVRLAYARGSR